MRAFGFPEFGVAGVFVLCEAVLHQAVILNRAGEDELVDEQDDGFGGFFGRRPFDLVELVEPDFEVFEELMFQFRFFGRVLHAAQSVEDAAGFAASGKKIGERQIGKRFVLKEKIARAEKPRRAEVGQNQVFVVAQIFLDLCNVVVWICVAAPKCIRAVALKERLEFQRQRFSSRLGQHEIHPSLAAAHLAGGLEAKNVFAKRGEKVFRRRFWFDDVLQVEDVLLDGGVTGDWPCVGGQRQKFNAFAGGELPQRVEDFSIIHGHVDCLPGSGCLNTITLSASILIRNHSLWLNDLLPIKLDAFDRLRVVALAADDAVINPFVTVDVGLNLHVENVAADAIDVSGQALRGDASLGRAGDASCPLARGRPAPGPPGMPLLISPMF